MTLEHSGPPTDQEVSQHTAGWRFHLDRLSLFANRSELTEPMEETVLAWFDAWNEPDGEERTRRLAERCEEGISFRGVDHARVSPTGRLRAVTGFWEA